MGGCCVVFEIRRRLCCVMVLTKWALSRNRSSWNGKQWRKKCAMLTGENPVGLRCMECGWCLIAWMVAQQLRLSVMDGWMWARL